MFPLHGVAERAAGFDVDERNREAGSRGLRAFPGIVDLEPGVWIAGEAGVQRAVGTTDDVHGIHAVGFSPAVPQGSVTSIGSTLCHSSSAATAIWYCKASFLPFIISTCFDRS